MILKWMCGLCFFLLICCKGPQVNSGSTSGRSSENTEGDTLKKDTLIAFRANPVKGFHFDYLVYLPKGLKRSGNLFLLVETNNTGLNDTIEVHERGARYAAARSSVGNYISKKLKIPLLVPVFPRSATDWTVYTHALDRETLLSTDPKMMRLDLQLLSMFEDAGVQLQAQRILINEKFLMAGFSASGTFANRFSMLHPQRLQAMAAGGINGIAILPLRELGGKELNYPLGINDLKEITGKEADLKAFRSLPKLLFMGASDENDAVGYDDAYNDKERETVYRIMGKQLVPDRWNFIRKVYMEAKVQADFRTYPNIGHGTDLRINNDLVAFFKSYLN